LSWVLEKGVKVLSPPRRVRSILGRGKSQRAGRGGSVYDGACNGENSFARQTCGETSILKNLISAKKDHQGDNKGILDRVGKKARKKIRVGLFEVGPYWGKKGNNRKVATLAKDANAPKVWGELWGGGGRRNDITAKRTPGGEFLRDNGGSNKLQNRRGWSATFYPPARRSSAFRRAGRTILEY